MLKSHFEGSVNTEDSAEVYEPMSTISQDIMMKYSGCSEDIYESMLGIDPECAEDLCKINLILFIGLNIDEDYKTGGLLLMVLGIFFR